MAWNSYFCVSIAQIVNHFFYFWDRRRGSVGKLGNALAWEMCRVGFGCHECFAKTTTFTREHNCRLDDKTSLRNARTPPTIFDCPLQLIVSNIFAQKVKEPLSLTFIFYDFSPLCARTSRQLVITFCKNLTWNEPNGETKVPQDCFRFQVKLCETYQAISLLRFSFASSKCFVDF